MSILLLVLLLVLVAINGFFVAAEFALVRSRRGKIEQLAEEGESGAETVVRQLDEIDESLSACQIGITMASIGIGFLGEPSLAKLLEPIFGGLSHGVAVALSVGIAFTIVTALSRCRRCWRSTGRSELRAGSRARSTGSASRRRR